MAKTDEKGNWIDASGHAVPLKYVDKIDKARDKYVEAVHKRAEKIWRELEAFRAFVDEGADAHLDLVAKESGLERNPGGNNTFSGFSGDKQVEIKQVLFLGYDERLQMAKQLIDECLTRWSESAAADLALVVRDAFQVDSKGRLNVREIQGMVRRTKAVKDPQWQRARDIIMDSMRTEGRRAYVQLRKRDSGNGEWRTIRLDLAATGAATGAQS